MANRNEESGRQESAYGRSGNPRERQQSQAQHEPWDQTQGGQQPQGQQYGGRQHVGSQGWMGESGQLGRGGIGQQGFAGQGFGEPRERTQGWESERGSDFYRGYGSTQGSERYGEYGQGGEQGSERYGQSGQGYGLGGQQGSERYAQGGQYGQGSRYSPGPGQAGKDLGQGGQQQEWQRGLQQQGQYGSQSYGQSFGQSGVQGQQGFDQGGGMSGGYGGQQLGYGSGLGQRGFRGVGPKNYSRSDERIREDVCERLTQDDDLDASEIEIKASQGVVTLEGTVGQRWMKHRAEDIAEGCSGVREVDNRIRVESGAGKGRSGSESLGKAGAQDEGRSQSSTRGSSGTSGFPGSSPH